MNTGKSKKGMEFNMKIGRILIVFILLLLIIYNISITSFATTEVEADGTTGGSGLEPKTAMNGMNNMTSKPDGADTLKPVLNAIIGVIQVAGTGISLIMVSVLGIRYMLASPNDKADVKKQIIPMIIGAIILFGSVNIIQIIANFTADTFK